MNKKYPFPIEENPHYDGDYWNGTEEDYENFHNLPTDEKTLEIKLYHLYNELSECNAKYFLALEELAFLRKQRITDEKIFHIYNNENELHSKQNTLIVCDGFNGYAIDTERGTKYIIKNGIIENKSKLKAI